jgi:hypothetical protein
MPITQTTYLSLLSGLPKTGWIDALGKQLATLWADDYEASNPLAELLETTLAQATYLFDTEEERLVGMYGQPQPAGHKRDASRMKGHPLSEGPGYHRGHMMAHTLGGGTDINLVPQLGSMNVGAFRELERLAQASSNCLYFVRPIYAPGNDGDTPDQLEQGLVLSGRSLQYRLLNNR